MRRPHTSSNWNPQRNNNYRNYSAPMPRMANHHHRPMGSWRIHTGVRVPGQQPKPLPPPLITQPRMNSYKIKPPPLMKANGFNAKSISPPSNFNAHKNLNNTAGVRPPTPPAKQEIEKKTYSNKEKLDELAKKLNLNPEYSTTSGGKKATYFLCVLKVGNKQYRSYPTEKKTAEEAEEVAAEKALNDLKVDDVPTENTLNVTTNNEIATQRIKQVNSIEKMS